jgi:ADP-ribose pyrophosphatase YjhB (NUDIX family)
MQPSVRATAVLIEGQQILLVKQRVSGSSERQWSLPGGQLQRGETLAQCLIREMREETGLEVALDRLLYVCDRIGDGVHVLHITFAVTRTGGELRLGCEPEPEAHPISDLRIVPLTSLGDYGFTDRFRRLAMQGFPGAGSYRGAVDEIGL